MFDSENNTSEPKSSRSADQECIPILRKYVWEILQGTKLPLIIILQLSYMQMISLLII